MTMQTDAPLERLSLQISASPARQLTRMDLDVDTPYQRGPGGSRSRVGHQVRFTPRLGSSGWLPPRTQRGQPLTRRPPGHGSGHGSTRAAGPTTHPRPCSGATTESACARPQPRVAPQLRT